MVSKDSIKLILTDNQTQPLPKIVPRPIRIPENTNQIITLIGSRRSGKTYLLYGIMHKLIQQGVEPDRLVYMNFEDDRLLGFDVEDFDLLLQSQRELHPGLDLSTVYFFFDEIQVVPNWETFVRRLQDTVTKNIFITGSNAKLLSTEIASSLRGRSISIEVYPLSFAEYLDFRNINKNIYSSQDRASIVSALGDYLNNGGFPATIDLHDRDRISLLQGYLDTMIYRDIIERYNPGNQMALKYFMNSMINNHATIFSVNKVYHSMKSLGLKVSPDTLYSFLDYATNIYAVQILKKYDASFRKSESGEKKIYAIDNGLFNAVSRRVSANTGRLLEGAVFNHSVIQHGSPSVSFYKESEDSECDFILHKNGQVFEAIQVTVGMDDEKTYKREIKGLKKACAQFNLDRGTIVSLHDQDREFEEDGITIRVVSAWRYLLAI